MKRFSWEIIAAGFVFIALAVYLLNLSDNRDDPEMAASSTSTEGTVQEEVRVFDFHQLEELERLKELKELDQLNDQEKLQSLKELATLMPVEIREEIMSELDQALRELSEEDFSVQIDTNDNIVIVNREFNIEEGTWSKTSPGVYTFQNEFDASNLESFMVNMPFGSITVIGADTNTGTFTIQASGKVGSEDELKRQIIVQSSQDAENVAYEIESKHNWGHKQNIHIQATITLPANTTVVTRTKGGHIKSTNISGEQVYETAGGHITLKNLNGEVAAETMGGHISIEDSKGEFALETKGGHLKARNITGEIVLNTFGGNVEADYIDGELSAQTKGGNVVINLTSLNHDIAAETFAGNVIINLPGNASGEVALEGNSGVELNGFSVNGNVEKNSVTGTLSSGGGSTIQASTKYGKVILKRND